MTELISTKHIVYYVDDDEEDIFLMKDALGRYPNLEIFCFLSAPEFLIYITNQQPFQQLPSLILLDVNMPNISGKQLLKMLRNIRELDKVNMVLYTTSHLPSEREFAKAFGADFITKPNSGKELHQIAKRLAAFCEEHQSGE